MDPKDIRTLQLLEEIEKNEMPSQRHLAKQLNISLGLVNSFIKRLASKGYLKITTIPKNRIRYLLTPKGASEKTRLTYEFIKFSYLFYKDARNKLRRIFSEFESSGIQTIAFYGATDLAEIAYLSLQETSIRLVAIIDENKFGKNFFNLTIEPPNGINKLDCDIILVTAIAKKDEIVKKIINKGVNQQRITLLE